LSYNVERATLSPQRSQPPERWTYDFFAYVSGSPSSLEASAPSAALFDQIVQTVTFTS
jgi:hypothetical protein